MKFERCISSHFDQWGLLSPTHFQCVLLKKNTFSYQMIVLFNSTDSTDFTTLPLQNHVCLVCRLTSKRVIKELLPLFGVGTYEVRHRESLLSSTPLPLLINARLLRISCLNSLDKRFLRLLTPPIANLIYSLLVLSEGVKTSLRCQSGGDDELYSSSRPVPAICLLVASVTVTFSSRVEMPALVVGLPL